MPEILELANQLENSCASLEMAFVNESPIFEELRETFEKDELPEREVVIPALNSTQIIIKALAELLGSLKDIFDADAIMPVRENMPFLRTGIGSELGKKIIFLFGAALPNEPHELWRRASRLWVSEIRYWGSTGTGASSVLSLLSNFTGFFEEKTETGYVSKFGKVIPKFLRKEYVSGLSYIIEYADFLAKTPEDQLHSRDKYWWCRRFDNVPHELWHGYDIPALMEHCPEPLNKEIINRIQRIAESEAAGERNRKTAQQRLRELT
ncbi:MAG: hypothetical protein GY805_19250 [Chloroflexi bacterium]|nr:hypothetical protein [Chloroflexota bacterium]